MTAVDKPRTAGANGRLWGMRSRDWADLQEGGFRAGYLAALERAAVGAGTRYLDAGCGSGMAAAMAADRGAQVTGIDASDSLLEIARERVAKGTFQTGDLEDLPFEDNSFDVVVGFNSFQYAGNPGAALAEARRVTVASGTVVIMTWGEPEGMEAAAIVGALKPLLPPPPPGAPGPFALSDEARLRAFAVEAGLKPLDLEDVFSPWEYENEALAVRGIGSSGVAAKAMDASGEDAVNAAHAAAIAPFVQADGRVRIGATCRLLFATPAG
jgi:SAM-dependent methyltransferase